MEEAATALIAYSWDFPSAYRKFNAVGDIKCRISFKCARGGDDGLGHGTTSAVGGSLQMIRASATIRYVSKTHGATKFERTNATGTQGSREFCPIHTSCHFALKT